MRQLTTISPSQSGFRPARSTTESVVALLMHLQPEHESRQEELAVFVDLKSMYDTVPREYITGVLKYRAVLEQYVALLDNIYSRSQMRVQTTEIIGLECALYCLATCFVHHAWGVKMVAYIGKKRLEAEDQYAAASQNIEKYCTHNAAVGEQEKGIICKKHTLTDNEHFCSNL